LISTIFFYVDYLLLEIDEVDESDDEVAELIVLLFFFILKPIKL